MTVGVTVSGNHVTSQVVSEVPCLDALHLHPRLKHIQWAHEHCCCCPSDAPGHNMDDGRVIQPRHEARYDCTRRMVADMPAFIAQMQMD